MYPWFKSYGNLAKWVDLYFFGGVALGRVCAHPEMQACFLLVFLLLGTIILVKLISCIRQVKGPQKKVGWAKVVSGGVIVIP